MTDAAGRITLRGIEVFMAAADERSISAAARRLGASPSSVSQQLSNLETALGTQLLFRNTRPLRLTPAGTILHRRAQVILDEAAQVRAELALSDLTKVTRFRLGMIEDLEADVTPRLLTDLAVRMPGAQFRLETGASHHLQDELEARSLDLIVSAQLAEAGDWAEVHPLLSDGFVLAVPRGRIDPGGDMLAQLHDLPFVQYTQRHYMGRIVSGHLARQNLRIPHRFELDSYHSILALVGQGAGWSILTPLAMHRARRFAGQVEIMELPFAPFSRTIALTARRDILQDLPTEVAGRLRQILQADVVEPALAAYPFLQGHLKLL